VADNFAKKNKVAIDGISKYGVVGDKYFTSDNSSLGGKDAPLWAGPDPSY
jgi:hypothetical protein